MTTFNNELTIQEATILFKHKGECFYPKTRHNIEIMKKVVDNYLKSLKRAKVEL